MSCAASVSASQPSSSAELGFQLGGAVAVFFSQNRVFGVQRVFFLRDLIQALALPCMMVSKTV